ncbi:unnamed protein product, partial [Didymodactylos carnosus]
VKMGRIPKKIKEKALREQEISLKPESLTENSTDTVPSLIPQGCNNNKRSAEDDNDSENDIIELNPSDCDTNPLSTTAPPVLAIHLSSPLQTLDTVHIMSPNMFHQQCNAPHLSLLSLPSFFYSSFELFTPSSSSTQILFNNDSLSPPLVSCYNTNDSMVYTSDFYLCTPPSSNEKKTLDETRKQLNVAHFIVKLSELTLIDYMHNCELNYAKNVISIMKSIAPK